MSRIMVPSRYKDLSGKGNYIWNVYIYQCHVLDFHPNLTLTRYEVQDAYLSKKLGLHPFTHEGIRLLEGDLRAAGLSRLGDWATQETKLGTSTSSYYLSRFLESIREFADDPTRAGRLLAAGGASAAHTVIKECRGYGSPFRAGHITLWLAAWKQLPVDLDASQVIGPNPKKFLLWAKEIEKVLGSGFTFDELLDAAQKLWVSQEGFDILGAPACDCAPLSAVKLQFVLCKIVQVIEFLAECRPTRWRAPSNVKVLTVGDASPATLGGA